MQIRFFDSAATTPCLPEAAQALARYTLEDFGNPSSSHALGQKAAKAVREARLYLANEFQINADQIIFCGSGTESDNLAIYGVAMQILAEQKHRFETQLPKPRILVSAIEHPAVRKTAKSLEAFGFEVHFIPVDANAQIQEQAYKELLTPETVLVSIMRVNNIVGAHLPVESLAQIAHAKVPGILFHSDCVQAFGKISLPKSGSSVDLLSISAHKIHGPKGIGALIVLNKSLLKKGLRPLVWGGEQEGGFRSGTQNAGLISAFKIAAQSTLDNREAWLTQMTGLNQRLRDQLALAQLTPDTVHINSPSQALPHIVSLSIPHYPSGPLAKLLEERGCIISTGSACSSQKPEPDAVLTAMGLPKTIVTSAIRVSFCEQNTFEDIDYFVGALVESIQLMNQLLGISTKKAN